MSSLPVCSRRLAAFTFSGREEKTSDATSVKKKATTEKNTCEQKESQEAEETEAVKRSVRGWHKLIIDHKLQEAGTYLLSRLKKEWHNTDWAIEETLKEVKILSSKVDWNSGTVGAREIWEGANGRCEQQIEIKMIKKGGKWLIDEFKLLEELSTESGAQPKVQLTEGTAWITVEKYLDLLRQNRTDIAKALVAENFLEKMGDDYYNATFSASFLSFSIFNSAEGDGYYVVKVREEWISGSETVYYTVVQRGDQLLVDYIDWGQ